MLGEQRKAVQLARTGCSCQEESSAYRLKEVEFFAALG